MAHLPLVSAVGLPPPLSYWCYHWPDYYLALLELAGTPQINCNGTHHILTKDAPWVLFVQTGKKFIG